MFPGEGTPSASASAAAFPSDRELLAAFFDHEESLKSALDLASVPFNSFIPEGDMGYDPTVFDRPHTVA